MELIFTLLARDELVEAKRFYNRQQQGLGDQFKYEAELASQRILEHPLAWQFEYDPVRRFIFNRFPYKMLYVIRDQKLSSLLLRISIVRQITGLTEFRNFLALNANNCRCVKNMITA